MELDCCCRCGASRALRCKECGYPLCTACSAQSCPNAPGSHVLEAPAAATPLPPVPRPVAVERRGDMVTVTGEGYLHCLPAKDVPRIVDALCREGFDGMDSGTRQYLREQAKLGKEATARLVKLQAEGAACPGHREMIKRLDAELSRVQTECDSVKRDLVLARNAGATEDNVAALRGLLVDSKAAEARAMRLAEIRRRNLERLRKKIERLEAEQATMFEELDDARRALVKLAKERR